MIFILLGIKLLFGKDLSIIIYFGYFSLSYLGKEWKTMLEYCFYYFKPNLVWECFSSLHCTKKAKTNIVEAGPHGKVQGSRNSHNKIELIDKRDSQLLTKQFLSTIIQASSSIYHKCSVHNHLGGGSMVKAWDREVCFFYGLRFEPYDWSYDGHWRLTWSLTSGPVGLVEVHAS